jgi:hypothetical protein
MTKMLAEGRAHATERLVEEAETKGANAILAFRFDTSELGARGRRSAPTGPPCARLACRALTICYARYNMRHMTTATFTIATPSRPTQREALGAL